MINVNQAARDLGLQFNEPAAAVRAELFLGLNETPALDLAIRGWAEMVEKGYGDGTLNCYSALNAFVGFAMNGREEMPVGVITFNNDVDLRRIWAFQVYTLPEFRGIGVYKALWAALVSHSKTLGAKSIQMGTHIRNSPMRAVGQKTGCIEEAVILRFNLE